MHIETTIWWSHSHCHCSTLHEAHSVCSYVSFFKLMPQLGLESVLQHLLKTNVTEIYEAHEQYTGVDITDDIFSLPTSKTEWIWMRHFSSKVQKCMNMYTIVNIQNIDLVHLLVSLYCAGFILVLIWLCSRRTQYCCTNLSFIHRLLFFSVLFLYIIFSTLTHFSILK